MKLPTSWRQVTLRKFIQLMDLPQSDNDVRNFLYKVSVLTDIDPDELKKQLTLKDVEKMSKKLAFLNELPKVKNRKSFWFKWKRYARLDFNDTTSMQIADIMQLNTDERNEGMKLLNVLSVVYATRKQGDYSQSRFVQNKTDFGSLPFDVAWCHSVFFLSGLKTYLLDALQGYSKVSKTMSLHSMDLLKAKLQTSKSESELTNSINGTTS